MNNLNLIPAYPEIFLLIAACAILLVDMFLKDEQRFITYILSLLAIAGTAVLTLMGTTGGEVVYSFNNMFVSDPLSQLLKMFTYLAVGVSLVYARQYATDRGIINDLTGGKLGGEFYALALFCMLGQMIMISANNFLTIYLGLELMSLSLYALVALRRDNIQATEAAMKYFVLGAMASGFLLYGMSMLYGATGSLELNEVFRVVVFGISDRTVLVFGIVFVVAGLAFKLGAVPFHMWAPDVYQGSPTAVTLLLGAAPKLATFAIAFRLLVEGMLPIAIHWQQMLMVMAVLSLVLGNITAIAQTNLKRMLAYSTISHMGFVLLGLLSGVSLENGLDSATIAYSSALFYMVVYVLTTLGTFGVVLLLARSGFEADKIEDFKGLNKRNPWFAGMMLIMLFSMAGIPPMVGFYAKLSVLQAVFAVGLPWLALIAVIFSLIGAYYYLRVIKVMYFDEPVDNTPIVASPDVRILLSLNGLAIIVLGIFPGPLLDACTYAIHMTFANLVGQ
jgi:NADH-quinone oxidoreductase subunit N